MRRKHFCPSGDNVKIWQFRTGYCVCVCHSYPAVFSCKVALLFYLSLESYHKTHHSNGRFLLTKRKRLASNSFWIESQTVKNRGKTTLFSQKILEKYIGQCSRISDVRRSVSVGGYRWRLSYKSRNQYTLLADVNKSASNSEHYSANFILLLFFTFPRIITLIKFVYLDILVNLFSIVDLLLGFVYKNLLFIFY